MMAMGFMELLLVLLSGGTGNDLLDYMPTQAYWSTKGVEVTVAHMAKELRAAPGGDATKLAGDLGADSHKTREAAMQGLRAMGDAATAALKKAAESEDPEVRTRARQLLQELASGGRQAKQVRRLMAIRALGESKTPAAVAALRPLLASKEPFIAGYARQAIAALEGKPYTRPAATKAELWKDVCLLPSGCAIVGQTTMPGGGPVDFAAALKTMEGKLPPGQDKNAMVTQLAAMLSQAAERVGNIRVHAVTLGVAGNVGDNDGYVVVIGRGVYDPTAVIATIEQFGKCSATRIADVPVLSPEKEVEFIPCSPTRFILVAGPRQATKPTGEIIAALKMDGDQPAFDPALVKLVRGIDRSAPLWAAIQMTDTFRKEAFLAPWQTVVITSQRVKDTMAVKMVARGTDAAAIAPSVDEFKTGLEKAKTEMQRAAGMMPGMESILDLVNSVRVEVDGATATVTGTLKGAGATMMMMPMMMFGVRSSPVGPPPMQVQPMPPQPVPAP